MYIDGASRNNPGLSGAGVYILKNGEPFMYQGFFLGIKTNNQAEYLALLVGIFVLQVYTEEDDVIRVMSDSQLLVRQLQGQYRVKEANLKLLHRLAHTLLGAFKVHLTHILRAENYIADQMANEGIDLKKPLSPEFITLLYKHGISL